MSVTTDTPPRRLTRDERRARTREDLLQAAAAVFGRRGYHGASLDEVAEAAGYTKGAVYSNFGSKEELFLEVAERHVQQIVSMLLGVFEDADPDRRLQVLFEHARKLALVDDFVLLDMEFRLYARRHPEARDKLQQRDAALMQGFGAALEAHFIQVGIRPELNAEQIARTVWALADGLALQGATDPGAVQQGLPGLALKSVLAGIGVQLPALSAAAAQAAAAATNSNGGSNRPAFSAAAPCVASGSEHAASANS